MMEDTMYERNFRGKRRREDFLRGDIIDAYLLQFDFR